MSLDRAGRALVVCALLTASLWFTPGHAAATSSGRCADSSGVSVVIDFGPLPGGTQVVCTGAGGNVKDVTVRGGFTVQYLTDQPYVCRIAGQPETCTRPGDKYWSLYWSDGSFKEWKYSTKGADSLTPRNGWSIGWRFQDGGARELPSEEPRRDALSPSPKPTAGPKPTASPKPTRPPKQSATPRPSAPAPSAAGPTAGGTTGPTAASEAAAPGKPKASRKPRAKRTASPTADPSSSDATELPTGEPTEAESADVADGSFATVTDDDAPTGGDGTGLAAVAGLGGLSLLAGSAAVVAWRRRT